MGALVKVTTSSRKNQCVDDKRNPPRVVEVTLGVLIPVLGYFLQS